MSRVISWIARATDDVGTSTIGVDVVGIDPLPCNAGADIGLCSDGRRRNDLDRGAKHLTAKVLDRHLRRENTTLAGGVGVEARHIVEHAELNDPVRDLGPGRSAANHAQSDRQAEVSASCVPP